MKNSTLSELNMGSNSLSEPTAALMAQVVVHNTTLQKLDLSCNRLGPVCIWYQVTVQACHYKILKFQKIDMQ